MEIKEGYQKTKLGWIPEDWEIILLKNLGNKNKPTIKAGPFGSALKKDSFVPSGFKVYGQEQVISDNPYLGDYYIDKAKFESLKSCEVSAGDILLSLVGTIGKVLIIPNDAEKGVINPRLLRISINQEENSIKFLGYFLRSSKTIRILKKWSQGGTMGVLNASILKALPIPIPPLIEQKKIAQILSTWDKAIEKTKQLIEQKKLLKKGLMQQLLTGKARFNEFKREEWQAIELGDVITRTKRKNEEEHDNVVTISAQRGFVKQETFFKKRVASKTLTNYYLVKRGEFAYNKSYSKGYPMGAFKRLDDFDFGVVTTLYICFAINEGYDSDFFLHFFEGGMMIKGLSKIAQEGGRAHGLLNISLGDFMTLKLRIPSLSEQEKIASVLNSYEKDILKQESFLDQLQEQKKGLMQQLLTGATRVKF